MEIFEKLGGLMNWQESPENACGCVADWEKRLQVVNEALGKAVSGRNRAHRQLTAVQEQSVIWEKKAAACLSQGNGCQAEQANAYRNLQDQLASQCRVTENVLDARGDELREQANFLQRKLAEAKTEENAASETVSAHV